MDKRLKESIMEYSAHQFIYGRTGSERTEFFRSLEEEYPIKVGEDAPMAIYVEGIFLPPYVVTAESRRDRLPMICREHFQFAVGYQLLDKVRKDVPAEVLGDRIEKLLKMVNRALLNRGHEEVQSLEELVEAFRLARDFYSRYYTCELTGGEAPVIDELKIPFVQLEFLIRYVKDMLENNGHFGIIIDNCEQMDIYTCQAINVFINARINRDISMKIATEPGEWVTYSDGVGNFIQAVHDYSTVDFDDSSKKYVMKMKAEMERRYE